MVMMMMTKVYEEMICSVSCKWCTFPLISYQVAVMFTKLSIKLLFSFHLFTFLLI